jgi:hypothetical protein
MPVPIDPVVLAKLVSLAVAGLYVRYPQALQLPREEVRRAAAAEVLAELRAEQSASPTLRR